MSDYVSWNMQEDCLEWNDWINWVMADGDAGLDWGLGVKSADVISGATPSRLSVALPSSDSLGAAEPAVLLEPDLWTIDPTTTSQACTAYGSHPFDQAMGTGCTALEDSEALGMNPGGPASMLLCHTSNEPRMLHDLAKTDILCKPPPLNPTGAGVSLPNTFTCCEPNSSGTSSVQPLGSPPFSDGPNEGTVNEETRLRELTCAFTGCARSKPFSRRWDLERHIASKHTCTKPYRCPAKGCFRKRCRTAFARPDKLTSHMRSVHSGDDLIDCPHPDCRNNLMKLAVLIPHLDKAHPDSREMRFRLKPGYDATSNAVAAVFGNHYKRLHQCPVLPCKKMVDHYDLLRHLGDHSHRDLEGVADSLRTRSIILLRSGHQPGVCATNLSAVDHNLPTVKIALACPACSAVCKDTWSFEIHLVDAHLIDGDQRDHFEAWRGYFKSLGPWPYPLRAEIEWYVGEPLKEFKCPACSWSKRSLEVDHHFDFHCDVTGLKPYRAQILAL